MTRTRDLFERIAIPVAVAVVLAVGGVALSWASGGGVVTALQGVSQAQLLELQKQVDHLIANQTLPLDAIVAFAGQSGCPSPWQPYKPLAGRLIVGAGAGFSVGDSGGRREVVLEASNLAPHQHETILATQIPGERPFGAGKVRNPALAGGYPTNGWETTMTSKYPEEAAKPVDILPPYNVLTYCKR